MPTLLAFDYGSRHIGVAVGQTVTASASPLATFKTRQNKPDWEGIGKLIREWRPDALVVGLPLHGDGSPSISSVAAERFSRQLHGRYALPVYLIDEYLSSHAAAERTDDDLHAVSAQIILETWLREHAA